MNHPFNQPTKNMTPQLYKYHQATHSTRKVIDLAGYGELDVLDWHSGDDFGQTLETVRVRNNQTGEIFDIYSVDEGESFTFEMLEI